MQISVGGHSHLENPLRSKAWHFQSADQQRFFERTQEVRIDGCMHDFRGLSGNLVLKPFRIRTSDPDAAATWHCVCNHRQPHKVLEGGVNVSNSAKYTSQMCVVIAKHILKRQLNLANACRDVVFSDKSRTQPCPADPVIACSPCKDEDDELEAHSHTAFQVKAPCTILQRVKRKIKQPGI